MANSVRAERCLKSAWVALLAIVVNPPGAWAQTVAGTIVHEGITVEDIAVYETGDTLFVSAGGIDRVLVYDVNTLSLVATIDPGGRPGPMVVDDAGGRVVVNLDDGSICIIDAITYEVQRTIPIIAYADAVDEGLGKAYGLFGPFGDSVIAIDLATGSYATAETEGPGLVSGIGLNPVTHEYFIARGPTLNIFDGVTLARTSAPSPSYFNMLVNWIENKVYFFTMGGFATYDRDDGSSAVYSADNDTLGYENHIFNPASNTMYVGSEINGVATVIDAATDTFVMLPMFSFTGAIAARHATGHVYFVGEGSPGSFVAVLDERTQIVETIQIADVAEEHTNVMLAAVDQTTGRILAAQHASRPNPNTVIQDGALLTRPPVYLGRPDGFRTTVVDPASNRLVDECFPTYTAQGLAVRPGSGRVLEPTEYGWGRGTASIREYFGAGGSTLNGFYTYITVENTDINPVTAVADPDGVRLYVSNSALGTVSIVDLLARTSLAEVVVGSEPWGMAIAPGGGKLYVACRGGGHVTVVDTASASVTRVIPVGQSPWGVAINPAGTRVYVANAGAGTVSVIDTATESVVDTVSVGLQPHWLTVTPDGRQVWVSNNASGTVSVISTADDTVAQTVITDASPEGVACLPDGSQVYVGTEKIGTAIDAATYSVTGLPLEPGQASHPGDQAVAVAVADSTARIAGRVTSWGCPIAGAEVTALQAQAEIASATTDANGDYSLFNLPPGSYDVEATMAGFENGTAASRPLQAGRTAVQHFPLEPASCSLGCCKATVPSAGEAGAAVSFVAPDKPGTCSQTVAYDWDFGDGSPHSTQQSPSHVYPAAGAVTWTLTIAMNGSTCTDTGRITVSPACDLRCDGTVEPRAKISDSVNFLGSVAASDCIGSPIPRWTFGDATPDSWREDLGHSFEVPGTYEWRFTATIGNNVCTDSGTIQITLREEVAVSLGGTPLADGQTTPIDFGTVALGSPGPTRTFTVRNEGGWTLGLLGGWITLPPGYTLVEGLTPSLEPGESDTFTVRL